MLQQSTISAYDGEREPSKVSRVFTKLCEKVMKDEHKKNSANLLGAVDLESFVFSLDWLLQTIAEKRSNGISNDLVKHAEEMAKGLVLELSKCRGDATREVLSHFEPPEGDLVGMLLQEALGETGTTNPGSSHAESTQLASLVHTYSTCSDGSDKQVALVALCDFLKANSDVNLETHLSPHASLPFTMHLLEEVRKASKENNAEHAADPPTESLDQQMKRLRDGQVARAAEDPPEDLPASRLSSSLRDRLEALKR